ncbi:MAG: thiamine pyrophosphate-dependent dehydrogenase E1 component subunit alpha [Thermoleophilia bacterium]|nr:thiamine pyrophosphate-dependent dehydrogenase E1 component subunit alpha [Thermoleophilia bacterium]
MSLFGRGRLPGFTHSYIGMEAVASGVCVGLRDSDGVTSTHRGHGHAIAKGLDLDRLMAELYGRSTGVCKGRGGSMHFADVERGMLGGNGIVAGGLPLATGAALARKLDGGDSIVIGFLGEGGVNQGTFHESLNLAAIWSLPIVYVIENNFYTEYSHYRALTGIDRLSDRAAAYGMPGVSVDGQDVLVVHAAANEAVERARRGEGPTLIEARTYRFRGHHEGEEQVLGTGVYRSVDEIQAARQERDPIVLARAHLAGVVPDERVDEIEREIAAAIQAAVEFAEASPLPEPHEATDFVYTTS